MMLIQEDCTVHCTRLKSYDQRRKHLLISAQSATHSKILLPVNLKTFISK